MSKKPKVPTAPAKPAPIAEEDPAVKAAGDRILKETAAKKGRDSTMFTNPASRTGFAGLFNKTTGSV